MGFNKRFISEETISNTLKNGDSLKRLFSADALLFMDNKASEVYQLYQQGLSDTNIKLFIDGKKHNN
jgi:hypothetical protein